MSERSDYMDINILSIDQDIQKSFPTNETHYSPDISIDQSVLSSSFKKKIDNWMVERKKKENDISKNFYHLDTLELLEKYSNTLQQPIKISFLNNEFVEEKCGNKEQIKIIENYVDTIKNYNMNLVYNPLSIISKDSSLKNLNSSKIFMAKKCRICQSENITESTECNNIIICIDCGNQETNLSLINSMKLNHTDSKRINICSKYSYEKKSHFINTINQFQGKYKSDIKKDENINLIVELIKKEIEKYNLIDHKSKNKYRFVTKEHIYLFLKDLEQTSYYSYVNLIHHKITGVPLNDISYLTEKLLQDFDQFVQMHCKLFSGKNFNYQFLLFQLLMRHKYPCSLSDFNFLKTTERKVSHELRCKNVFEELGWNYVSVF